MFCALFVTSEISSVFLFTGNQLNPVTTLQKIFEIQKMYLSARESNNCRLISLVIQNIQFQW